MFCPKCGAENAEQSAFCLKCGQPLNGQAPAQSAPAAQGDQPAMLKRACASVWFRVGVIALTVAAAGQLLSLFAHYLLNPLLWAIAPGLIGYLTDVLPESIADHLYPASFSFGGIVAGLFSMAALGICALKGAGLWLMHLDAGRKDVPGMDTRGVTILRIALLARVIYLGVDAVYVLISTIRYFADAARYGRELNPLFEAYDLFKMYSAIAVGVVVCLFLMKLLAEGKTTLETGRPMNAPSLALFILLCVLSFLTLLNGSLAVAVEYAAFAVVLFLLRRDMTTAPRV